MELEARLDEIVKRWDLLKHPFYQSWSAGTLPKCGLESYAREYGAFIALLPQGWKTLSDPHTAEEEEEHLTLWREFAAQLNTTVGQAEIPLVADLVETAHDLFARPSEAAGAMYAFEVQQPETAQSKLDGLKVHYDFSDSSLRYFEEHARNEHEREKLLERMKNFPSESRSLALQACETMCKALWGALDGIYQDSGESAC